MAGVVDFAKLGGIIPKTVTRQPRAGNAPPRTVETASGMLNAIGLDNDGIEHFIAHHLPYLRTLPTAIIANIAGKNEHDFVDMAAMLGQEPGLAALELNLSCPNVSRRRRLRHRSGRDAARGARRARRLSAAAHRQADAERDRHRAHRRKRRRRREPTRCRWSTPSSAWPSTGGGAGRSSATSPAASAARRSSRWPCGWSGRRRGRVRVPIIGIGGIATIDDVMEFLVAGASAVQLGTVNFYDPTASMRIVEQLPAALDVLGAKSVGEVLGNWEEANKK